MLNYLSVKNLATVEEIKVEFRPGLNILTGSTGAGKSVILGSLNLILGDKADSDSIRTGAETAVVEALFSISDNIVFRNSLRNLEVAEADDSLVIRREINARGTSKAFVNGRLVTLSTLRRICEGLVDLQGQHQHQSLLDVRQHLDFVDRAGNLLSLGHALRELFEQLRAKEEQLRQVQEEIAAIQEKRELYQFQLKEFEQANLQPGEEKELSREKSVLENVERIAEKVNSALASLQDETGSVLDSLSTVTNSVRQASTWDTVLGDTCGKLEENLLSLKELSRELNSYRSRLEYDPARLEFVRDRLSTIVSLKRKYGKELDQLVSWQQQLRQKLEGTQAGNSQIEKLRQELSQMRDNFRRTCLDISEKRKTAAAELEKHILKKLQELGLDKIRFKIGFAIRTDEQSWLELKGKRTAFDQTGFDRVEFLISPNPGEDLKPLAKIASGGELSRVMLALKSLLAQKDNIPVLVFDEIDAGIGGEIAEAVGRKLKALSKSHQILCITHLQQIASFADTHYKVEKNSEKTRTITTIRRLDRKEKVEEIARMISGENITPLAQKQASLMIEQAAQS
jgi:DNA repair protein RecN (Recombination protein N)